MYKVKDLVKDLLKLDQNAVVVKTTDNFEQGQSTVLASSLDVFDGTLEKQSFRDAFDGGSYSSEVVKRVLTKDKKVKYTKFVKVY